MRILVAEDEKNLNSIIVKKLTVSGYTVDSCTNGKDALAYLLYTEYDAAILDIMMPQKNGIDIVNEIKNKGIVTPVLFLTARDSIQDRVKGLDAGADDYLVKPFSFDELLARIRVLTRKSNGNLTNIYKLADLEVNTLTRTVMRGQNNINLSAKEFAVLEYMIANRGYVLTREKIEDHIWNYEYSGGTNVVDVYIRYLRKKIDDGFDNKLIHTVRGVGYVMREEI